MRGPDPERLIHDVGRRVAELRAARGLTQAELAERLDLALQNLQRVEHGGQNLTIRTLARLAAALGCTVPDLLAAPTTRAAGPGRPRKVRPGDAISGQASAAVDGAVGEGRQRGREDQRRRRAPRSPSARPARG